MLRGRWEAVVSKVSLDGGIDCFLAAKFGILVFPVGSALQDYVSFWNLFGCSPFSYTFHWRCTLPMFIHVYTIQNVPRLPFLVRLLVLFWYHEKNNSFLAPNCWRQSFPLHWLGDFVSLGFQIRQNLGLGSHCRRLLCLRALLPPRRNLCFSDFRIPDSSFSLATFISRVTPPASVHGAKIFTQGIPLHRPTFETVLFASLHPEMWFAIREFQSESF